MRHTHLALTVVFAACVATPGDETLDEAQQDVDSSNGVSLNGVSLNGVSLNGVSLNGVSLNGVSLNGTSFVGGKWTATTTNGVTVPLRIDAAKQGTGTNADIWFYAVSYQTTTGWSPMCGLDNAGAIYAIAVPGVWSSTAAYTSSATQFTFACHLKTVAKCVEMGYKPWTGRANQLATCTRLLRADYCGTGISYTVDGTLLNLYDNVGIQADTEAWEIEAEWTPAGARCVTSAGDTRFTQQSRVHPPCFSALNKPSCGTFANGALMIDELAPLK